MPHPLDNPAWHALTGPHARFAEGAGAARRYRPEVSFFAAVDRTGADAWAALADLAGPGGEVVLSRPVVPEPPAAWREVRRLGGHQMVLAGGIARAAGPLDTRSLRPLTLDDVPAMTALVEAAQPGPFVARTVELGGYVGFDDDAGRLVAMAGRRLALDGYVEISAVCVHPDATRRGLGAVVTAATAASILAEGATPFLHVARGNDTARRLYERLGFAVRTSVDFVIFGAPAGVRVADPAGATARGGS